VRVGAARSGCKNEGSGFRVQLAEYNRMKWFLWGLLIALGIAGGGWMTFDALRRFLLGDYLRIQGQLGPWQHLFRAIGVDPMGLPVGALYLVCGVSRLLATAGLLLRARWGWEGTLLAAIASLWFLPVGTVNALLAIGILFLPAVRLLFRG
jgi:hypothetical protein